MDVGDKITGYSVLEMSRSALFDTVCVAFECLIYGSFDLAYAINIKYTPDFQKLVQKDVNYFVNNIYIGYMLK